MRDVDGEKVCKGLRCHSDVFNEEPDCEHCEYDNANCGLEVPSDALALIRQQQERIAKLEAGQSARVMTLEEVQKADCGIIYAERWGAGEAIPARFSPYDTIRRCLYFFTIGDPLAYAVCADTYGKTWRCWTSIPTDEQREAAKWE